MRLQISDSAVIAKIDALAKSTGLSRSNVIEQALERGLQAMGEGIAAGRMATLLAQLDAIPDRTGAFEPHQWDRRGLPI